ncbi:MAG: NAD(P)-dependent oxidoreductase [Candidatus Limnocylindrales bacterium]
MERVGFVGLGTMGAAMAANLVRAGYPLHVWNRTPGRSGPLVGAGAVVAQSPRELAAAVDIVVICVSDTPDVEAVLFGVEGVVHGARPGTLVIDCSTISPSATRNFARRLADRGVALIDAPVSGGSEGAIHATLTIMVGGETADVERGHAVLAAMGRTVTHMGPVGAGQATKAVNQVMISGTYLGVAEGLVLAMKAGLDPEAVVSALGGGAAQSWVLANRSGRMVQNRYPLGFKVSLHRKDLGIALDMAREAGASLPIAVLPRSSRTGSWPMDTATRTCPRWRVRSASCRACRVAARLRPYGVVIVFQGPQSPNASRALSRTATRAPFAALMRTVVPVAVRTSWCQCPDPMRSW